LNEERKKGECESSNAKLGSDGVVAGGGGGNNEGGGGRGTTTPLLE